MVAAPLKLPGTHRVKAQQKSGRTIIYWYRYRGGPLMMRFEGDSPACARIAEARGAKELAAAYAAEQTEQTGSPKTVAELVVLFKKAPDGFLKLAESTRIMWRRILDEIIHDFGTLPIECLETKDIRRTFNEWRNEKSSTPRTADFRIQVLKRVLSWSVDHVLIDSNRASGIKALYRSNRSDLIVEPDELERIVGKATPRSGIAFRLAAATGLRRSDLIALQWEHVSDTSISMTTAKSGGTQRVFVPLLPEAKAVLVALREERRVLIAANKIPSAFVLTNAQGKPWAKNGLTLAFVRAAKAASVEGRTLHDLRGTAATRLALAEVADEDIADIMGWSPAKVRGIMRRYVSRDRKALAIAEKVSQFEEKKAG